MSKPQEEKKQSSANEPRKPKKPEELSFYGKSQESGLMGREEVRDIILAELRNFRSNLTSSWGGFGNSGPTVGGNVFGFFAKQPHGFFNQSPHQLQGSVDAATGVGTRVAGNDFGRIFVEELPDTGSDTPSWSFDLPAYSQKMLVKSTGPGLVYNSETAAFAAGEKITGDTSGATAYVSAVFPEGTNGTLYLYNVVGDFTDSEDITGSLGGGATVTRLTYTRTNPIFRVYGVGGESADVPGSIFTFWGLVDLFAPIALFNQPSSLNGTARDVEQIPAFENNGTMYVRNTGGTRSIRAYLNGSWGDIGGGGSSGSSVTGHTQNLTTTSSAITYAHGLGRVPSTVRIQATVGVGLSFCDCTYDGTSQRGLIWGPSEPGAVNTYSVVLAPSAGNVALGRITSVDATNVTIDWSNKSGSPTGTADLVIIAS